MAIRTVYFLSLCLALGCDATPHDAAPINFRENAASEMTQQPQFTVHDVFYIAPPVDSVIATGVVDAGTFHVGDNIVIGESLTSTIGKIEVLQQPEGAQQATAGDNVGFHLTGVDRNVVKSGDKIIRAPRE